jgi:hypothetical protein
LRNPNNLLPYCTARETVWENAGEDESESGEERTELSTGNKVIEKEDRGGRENEPNDKTFWPPSECKGSLRGFLFLLQKTLSIN